MKRKTVATLIATMAIVFTLAFSACAQEPPPPPGGGPGGPGMGMDGPRGKLQQRIEQMIVWELGNAMSLSSEKEKKLMAVIRTHFKTKKNAMTAQFKAMKALQDEYKNSNPSEAKLKKALDQILAANSTLAKADLDLHKQIRKVLSVKEQAKFYIEWPKALDRIRDTVKERRGMMRGGKNSGND
jgi:hypothetical protein